MDEKEIKEYSDRELFDEYKNMIEEECELSKRIVYCRFRKMNITKEMIDRLYKERK